MVERKVEVREKPKKTSLLQVDDSVLDTLISLAQAKRFRAAWEFIRNNADVEHSRFYNASVLLQHLSNQYGDIGNLKDECILQKELDRQATRVVDSLL